jgi:hypothetical protein
MPLIIPTTSRPLPRVVQDGKTITAKKNFVWTCNKDTKEHVVNDGNVVEPPKRLPIRLQMLIFDRPWSSLSSWLSERLKTRAVSSARACKMRMPTTREANVCIQSTRPTARLLSVARTETSARPVSEASVGRITPLAHVCARAAHGTLQLSRKGLRDSYAGERAESQ